MSELISSRIRVRHLSVVLTGCIALALLVPVSIAQDESEDDGGLPLYGKLKNQIPSVETLLDGEPVDWLVLNQKNNVDENEVLIVQPISPRPNTLEKLAKRKAALGMPGGERDRIPGESEQDYRQRIARAIEESDNVIVLLPDSVTSKDDSVDQAAEYTLKVKDVALIIHHEDLFLQRCEELIKGRELAQAFEMLLILQRRTPDWPRYDLVRNKLILEEGKIRLEAGDLEAALAFFEELHSLNPEFGGLSDQMGAVVDRLVTRSDEAGDLPRARYYVNRLQRLEPNHATVAKWVASFTSKADVLLDEAATARQAGRHDEALQSAEEAAAIWPQHPRLRDVYGDVAERFQVLKVGVFRFSGEPTPYFLPTPADQRHASLQTLNLFEISRFQLAAGYGSRYFEEWTPTDLGRRLVFRLKSRRSAWEPNISLTAPQVVRSIGDRLRPASAYYDERLAAFVNSMEVRSPFEFTLYFKTVPVRPQALFRFPIREPSGGPLSASIDDSTGITKPDSDVLSSRFVVQERDENRIVFRRAVPQADRGARYNTAEIVETRYDDHEAAIQAVLRGDISVLPTVPIWLASMFEPDERFFTVPYSVPTTHILQFNPDSESMKVAEFRRSIAYMLDRERILKTTVLKDQGMKRGRIVSGPFSTRSYAYNRNVEPRPKDLTTAFSLKTIASKRMPGGEIPELTMICEPNAVVLAAAEKLVEQWGRFNIKVNIVPQDQPTPEKWDIIYRTVRLTEPVTDLWPFLTMKSDARVTDLEHLPDWLRQQLIELEQSVDFRSSVSQLRGLHFRLNELVHLIPLWEVDDVIVVRRNIQGFPQQIVEPYQNVERWFIGPWFPKDLL